MRVDLVVFDIAGTTVHDGDAVHRCLSGALAHAGVHPTREAINRVMGMPKPLAIARLVEDEGSVADVRRLYADFERLMLEHYRTSPEVRETEGASDAIRHLRSRGVKVALDTGFARAITDVILGRLGWASGFVDATVSSDEVARGRPHPDLVERAMHLTGTSDPSRVAKVGDTPADLREGAAAGCGFTIGVTSGSHTREELSRHPHTHLIASLRELPRLFEDPIDSGERAPGQTSVPLLFTPGPLTTSAAVKRAMLRDLGSRDAEFIGVIAGVRDRLLSLASVSRDRGYEAVLLQGSGTYGVEAMLGTFVPRDGRLLVIDNGAYGARMAEIARALGVDAVRLVQSPTKPIDPVEVARVLTGERGITHVAAVQCETTTGVLNPIAAIGAVARDASCAFLVDAMSSFGAVPIDLVEDNIDALVSSSNKCLEGVPGCAFTIARREFLSSPSSAIRPSVALDLVAQWRGFERDGQFRFTPPTHVILALERALEELMEEGGVAGRAARYRANRQRLLSGMRALGFTELVAPEYQSDIITAFRCPVDNRFKFSDFYDRLRQRDFVIYPGKLEGVDSFRIGSIGRLYPEDMAALVDAIREVLKDMGVLAIRTAGTVA